MGDVVGSYFEHFLTKYTDFELFTDNSFFTDDTVLTVAIADWIMNAGDLQTYFYDYVERYPGLVLAEPSSAGHKTETGNRMGAGAMVPRCELHLSPTLVILWRRPGRYLEHSIGMPRRKTSIHRAAVPIPLPNHATPLTQAIRLCTGNRKKTRRVSEAKSTSFFPR
ncbi:MAG: hypothetical protein ACF8AM_04575 [Rhodopirellula sp. JB055]|uniref:hypothetical protein n=1 Tax=Rhodopirellula sp. JB055 TaxID=3342846 RepID=UPI003709FBDF